MVTGLVLAAGGSRRLGQPKQLLPFEGRPLLDATLAVARRAGFDQLIVAVGGSADDVRREVDLAGCEVVVNAAYGEGCSSSIAAALRVVDPQAAGIVLLLGDQPGVSPEAIAALLDAAPAAAMAVCHYADGRGHPIWLARSVFDDLAQLHGDKGVWRLLESGRHGVAEVAVPGAVPVDVDTWVDYAALVGGVEAEVEADRRRLGSPA